MIIIIIINQLLCALMLEHTVANQLLCALMLEHTAANQLLCALMLEHTAANQLLCALMLEHTVANQLLCALMLEHTAANQLLCALMLVQTPASQQPFLQSHTMLYTTASLALFFQTTIHREENSRTCSFKLHLYSSVKEKKKRCPNDPYSPYLHNLFTFTALT